MTEILCGDIGYSYSRLAVWRAGELSCQQKFETPNRRNSRWKGLSADEFRGVWLADLRERLNVLRDTSEVSAGLALSVCGVVSSDGSLSRSSSIWGDATCDLTQAKASDELGLRTLMANDLTAACHRYAVRPENLGLRKLLVVTVSSGIGAKTYDCERARVDLEPSGRNGEIGFALVEEGDQAYTADNGALKGVLNNYASGIGFTRILRDFAIGLFAPEYSRSLLRQALADAGSDIASASRGLLNKTAIDCLHKGDTFVRMALEHSIKKLSIVLAMIILYDPPSRIIIRGGFASAIGDLYRRILVSHLKARVTMHSPPELNRMVVMGYDDDLDCLIGSSLLWEQTNQCSWRRSSR